MTFFFAGMDTTGVTTGQSFYQLCRNPELMKKVQEELRIIIPDNGTAPEKITAEHLAKLDYVGAVAKETLRMYGPVSLMAPRSVLEECKIGGWFKVFPG